MFQKSEIKELISDGIKSVEIRNNLRKEACDIRDNIYGRNIFIRGLIEISNCCKNDCYYCGIRRSNKNLRRYRLSEDEILYCCRRGYELGFRTFVLQGGEDAGLSVSRITSIVEKIKKDFLDCAITLSLGEYEKEVYLEWFFAGADRYLLRHETADKGHYERLHPKEMSFEKRKESLFILKEIGYQTGAGMMIGSPGQSIDALADDIMFLMELNPHMVGIGPFMPHHDTPFSKEPKGSLDITLLMLAITRRVLPSVLLPSTTALASIHESGRVLGLDSGANVIMPNLSPEESKKDYSLYDGKLYSGQESGEEIEKLKNDLKIYGYNIAVDRGDYVRTKFKKC